MTTLMIRLTHLSDEGAIAIANILSNEIDTLPSDSISESDYCAIMNELRVEFIQICNFLKSRGIEFKDVVTCPDAF